MSQENAELDVEMPEPMEEEVEVENQELEVEEEEPPPEMEIKEIIPDAEVFRDAPPQVIKKPKRKATEKQKAHLAKIRVKALEAKKKKREAKMGVKPPKAEPPQMEVQEPEPAPTPNPKPLDKNEVPESLIHLTPQQLRQLQIEAIGGYDAMRKNRKAKKREAQAKEAQEKETLRVIQKAVKPHDDDGWGVCFQ